MCAVSCEMTDQLFLLAQCIHILHQQIVESFGCQQCNVKIPAHKRAVGNYIYVLTHTHTHTYTHTFVSHGSPMPALMFHSPLALLTSRSPSAPPNCAISTKPHPRKTWSVWLTCLPAGTLHELVWLCPLASMDWVRVVCSLSYIGQA